MPPPLLAPHQYFTAVTTTLGTLTALARPVGVLLDVHEIIPELELLVVQELELAQSPNVLPQALQAAKACSDRCQLRVLQQLGNGRNRWSNLPSLYAATIAKVPYLAASSANARSLACRCSSSTCSWSMSPLYTRPGCLKKSGRCAAVRGVASGKDCVRGHRGGTRKWSISFNDG